MNLRPQNRFRIPNSLAIFAVLLLLVTAATGFDTDSNAASADEQTRISVKADSSENNSVNSTAKSKSRGINLGLLLFRRG